MRDRAGDEKDTNNAGPLRSSVAMKSKGKKSVCFITDINISLDASNATLCWHEPDLRTK